MKQILIVAFFVAVGFNVFSQTDSANTKAGFVSFWEEQNAHYKDKEESPLDKKARKAFMGHRFFEFDPTYVIQAKFVRYPVQDTVIMQTSAATEKKFLKYAQLHFNVGHSHCHLTVYQSVAGLEKDPENKYLFIPFKDLTSGKDTYGGGRYLDILIPEGDAIILNFNLAYNPYCAYSDGYFCPIPPAENTLNVEIKAGAMAPAHSE